MLSILGHRSKKPSPRIDSMCVYNRVDMKERWIPILIKKGSWITMQQDRRRNINPAQSHFISAWKGKVKDFKIEKKKRLVLVQYVFMHREVHVPQDIGLPQHRPNCKYLHYLSTLNFN